MKFTKKICGNGKSVWDAPREGNEFIRITTNLSGQYGLFHCYGLAENGITPLRSDLIARSDTLNGCKRVANGIYDPKAERRLLTKKAAPDYSHIRMPYKD